MARYGQQFKERVVARLLPPESSPVEEVSNRIGISAATLERWCAEFLAKASDDQSRRWTPPARLEAVIATAGLDETARSARCREHGVFPTTLDAWKRDAIAGLGEPAGDSAAAKQEQRRKDKALAETAVLLVLSKELQAIFHEGEDA